MREGRGNGRLTAAAFGAAFGQVRRDLHPERVVRVDRVAGAADDPHRFLWIDRRLSARCRPRGEQAGGTDEGEDLDGLLEGAHVRDLERRVRERVLALQLAQDLEPLEAGRLLQVGRDGAGLGARALDDRRAVVMVCIVVVFWSARWWSEGEGGGTDRLNGSRWCSRTSARPWPASRPKPRPRRRGGRPA